MTGGEVIFLQKSTIQTIVNRKKKFFFQLMRFRKSYFGAAYGFVEGGGGW